MIGRPHGYRRDTRSIHDRLFTGWPPAGSLANIPKLLETLKRPQY
jgi:hypothetical protein